MKAGVSLV